MKSIKIPISKERIEEANRLTKAGKYKDATQVIRNIREGLERFARRNKLFSILLLVLLSIPASAQYDSGKQRKLERQFNKEVIRAERKAKRQRILREVTKDFWQALMIIPKLRYLKKS